jgi:hypothetical protein
MIKCNFRYYCSVSKDILQSTAGNFAVMGALLFPILIVAAGGAVDVANAYAKKKDLQERLDAGVLSAAPQTAHSERTKRVEQFMALGSTAGVEGTELGPDGSSDLIAGSSGLQVTSNSDGSVTADYTVGFRPTFLSMIGLSEMTLKLSSRAFAEAKQLDQSCIYSLGNTAQNVLINSGANVKSEKCGVNVHSTSNPAFIMNSGSKIDTRKFCVKGTQSIENGGTITNLQKGCTPDPDPWAGKIAAPTMPTTCTTSGAQDGSNHKIKAGMHCNVNFNGSPTITFEPGLHILRDTMVINSGSTIIADGVTFYLPNSDVELRANGAITATMKAPTSGAYKGILMFETPTKQYGSRPFVFNGSKSELLEGVIYLPNRDVTYNSTTNQVNKIQLIVNSLIINSANWKIEPYGAAGSGKSSPARLVR